MDLQIIRTRHPPEIYLSQLTTLLQAEGFNTDEHQIIERLDNFPKEDRLLMAVEGELLLGYAHLHIAKTLSRNPAAEIVAIIVRAERRRQGIGRRLIAAAETWARQDGREHMLLHTEVIRTEAHAFYAALGYEKSATTIEFQRDL